MSVKLLKEESKLENVIRNFVKKCNNYGLKMATKGNKKCALLQKGEYT